MGGDGGCTVGEVQAGTTSPMPDCDVEVIKMITFFRISFETIRLL